MEEYIDILNEKGELTGEVRTKKEVHRLGLWHKSSHIWVLNSRGELLIQHRAKEKENYGGAWDISAAGHVSAGESGIETAIREFREELGIELKKEELQLIGKLTQENIINHGTYIEREYSYIYLVEKDIPLSEMVMQKSEVEDLMYIHWKDLQKWVENNFEKDGNKLVPHLEEYKLLFNYLEEKFKKE